MKAVIMIIIPIVISYSIKITTIHKTYEQSNCINDSKNNANKNKISAVNKNRKQQKQACSRPIQITY